MTDDNCPAAAAWFHGVADDPPGGLYPESETGDVGQVTIERGDETFRVTVENVSGLPEPDVGILNIRPWTLQQLTNRKGRSYWKDDRKIRGDSLDDYVDIDV